MSTYVRPAIETPVFRDAHGQVIEYGSRWGSDGPPEDTYSVVTHPERFAPLHVVADALVAHLSATYDVDVLDDPVTAWASGRIGTGEDVSRSVRIAPRRADCATLTVVFTPYPGVILHAGATQDFPFPSCGCDACDESGEAEAERLEEHVIAVVTGNFRERIGRGRDPWVEHELTLPSGSSSGRSRASDLPVGGLALARETLRGITGPWAPWPLRADAAV